MREETGCNWPGDSAASTSVLGSCTSHVRNGALSGSAYPVTALTTLFAVSFAREYVGIRYFYIGAASFDAQPCLSLLLAGWLGFLIRPAQLLLKYTTCDISLG